MNPTDRRPFVKLVERIDPHRRLVDTRRLTGGVSAEATLLQVEDFRGRQARWVVRRHGKIDRSLDPHIARHEYRLLTVLRHHGIKAPQPIFVDETCDLFPTPVIVVAFIDGEALFDPGDLVDFNPQVADELRRIHDQVDVQEVSFLKPLGSGVPPPPERTDESLMESEIRRALLSTWPSVPISRAALLHGDYWPGNWLWKTGRLVGVIDWEDARIGDPLADLGNVRLETLFFFGEEAMEDLTLLYLTGSLAATTHLAYWDLRAALRPCGKLHTFGLEPELERTIRSRHARFVTAALRNLGF